MKLESLSDDYNGGCNYFIVFLLGLAGTAVLLGLGFAIYTVISNHLIWDILRIVGILAVAIPSIWTVGHIITRKLSQYTPRCGCGAKYNFFWTEWWHKKNCLAHALNGK